MRLDCSICLIKYIRKGKYPPIFGLECDTKESLAVALQNDTLLHRKYLDLIELNKLHKYW